jgi:hypothetical protein
MTDTMTSQNIVLSSWDTLYIQPKHVADYHLQIKLCLDLIYIIFIHKSSYYVSCYYCHFYYRHFVSSRNEMDVLR